MPEDGEPAVAKHPRGLLDRWLSLQLRLEESILSYGILAIAGLMVMNVLCRAFLGFSLTFTEELSQFLIVMVCFVGLSYATAQGRHIRMTAFLEQFPGRTRRRIEAWIALSTGIVLSALVVWSSRYVLVMADLGSVSPVLSVPLYMVYATAPLGFFLAAARYFAEALVGLRRERHQPQNSTPQVRHGS